MPNYISVKDQGFFEPFQALGHGIASALGLVQHSKDQEQQAAQFKQTHDLDQAKFDVTKPLTQAEAEKAQLALRDQRIANQLKSIDWNAQTKAVTDASANPLTGNPFSSISPGDIDKLKFHQLPATAQQSMLANVNKDAVKGSEISHDEVAKAFNLRKYNQGLAVPPDDVPGFSVDKFTSKTPDGPVDYESNSSNVATPIPNADGQPSGFVKIGKEVKPAATSRALSDGDKALASNTAELRTNLQELKKVVKDYGSTEVGFPAWASSNSKGAASGKTSNEASALLKSLAYRAAISYAKVVDPATAAREGEVESAKKFAIPMGPMTPDSVTLTAIDSILDELDRRESENASLREQQGLPNISLSPKVTAPKSADAPKPIQPDLPIFSTQEEVKKHKGKGPFIWGPTGARLES